MTVGIAFGDSTEFLMCKTYERLENVNEATAGGWVPARWFEELDYAVKGDALEAFDEIDERDYPNPAEKTDANYEELQRQIITLLSDHSWPGGKIHLYLTGKIKYMNCKMEDGRIEKPTKVLSRMQKIRRMGTAMHHNMGVHYMTEVQFNQAYWQIYPSVMTDWLTNNQNVDPFDAANPLDAAQIGDHMQRYWNLNLKNVKKDNSSRASKRKRDDEEENSDNGSENNDSMKSDESQSEGEDTDESKGEEEEENKDLDEEELDKSGDY